jgi:hypothetical protein
MEFEEFETGLAEYRRGQRLEFLPEEFDPFESLAATDADLAVAEAELGVHLPEKYKEFMKRHGGGVFGFVELLPVKSPDQGKEDLLEVNASNLVPEEFIAIAPVGTGDWWGFSVVEGRCQDEVGFLDHEDGHVEPAAADTLEFLTRVGLRLETGS